MADFIRQSEAAGTEVLIAGAGLAAALPGAVAALTIRPVLGVPVQSDAFQGQDAIHAIAQMPPGIPVGAVAIGPPGAVNAALLAGAILSGKHPEYETQLKAYRAKQADKISEITLPCEC